jgi:hypothetical protein
VFHGRGETLLILILFCGATYSKVQRFGLAASQKLRLPIPSMLGADIL